MDDSTLNFSLSNSFPNPNGEYISSLAFTKNNNKNTLLAASTSDKYITVYELENRLDSPSIKRKFAYKFHLYGINKIKFNSDSTLLASGANDLSVNIFDIEKQCLFRSFTTESIVTSLDINKTSNLLIIGAYENYVSLYDIRTKNNIAKMISHSEPITSVVFSDDSTMFISTSYDSFCRIWDVFKFSCLKTYALEKSPPLNSCCLMPNENYLLLNAFEGRNEIVNITTDEEVKKFIGNKHQNYLVDCAIYKRLNGNYHIISGDEEGKLCNWNILGNNKCQKFEINKNCIINSLDWTDGIVACSGMNDDTNSIYLLKELEEEKTMNQAMEIEKN